MADKLEMKTKELSQENIAKIQAIFPNCVTEVERNGRVELAVDFDALKQELTASVVSGQQERYQMTWPNKGKAKVLANSSISATLRPCIAESVNFDHTQNMYIEGDNLDVLKLLRETYLGKIKMIYIDPPYNTGNDFIYADNFAQSEAAYLQSSGQYDEQGNQLVRNVDSNGRFHTDWLNMIYPRLKIARDLLSDDGVIFISIDDHEVNNLRKICDEIFGEGNFVANIVWQSTVGSNTGSNTIVTVTENILVYGKTRDRKINKEPFENDGKMTLRDEFFEKRGFYALDKLDSVRQSSHYSEALNYPITCPDGSVRYPGGFDQPQSGWNYLWSRTKVEWGIANGFIVFKKTGTGWNIYNKRYELVDNCDNPVNRGNLPRNIILSSFATTSTGASELQNVMGRKFFDYPKPVKLLKKLISLGMDSDGLILDFFSGSASTAQAILEMNAEDGGSRKFILVQLPEKCEETTEAYKSGYKTICDIGKDRIRRAGTQIKEAGGILAQNLDIGFRVLKLDSSNMQDVYYNPSAISQSILEQTIDNVKMDRTPLDLLFQVMLELGIQLSATIEEKSTHGKKYYTVNGNDIIACFDDDIDNDVITEIAKLQPIYAVFKDRSFASDSVEINNEQLFKTYSPSTEIKII